MSRLLSATRRRSAIRRAWAWARVAATDTSRRRRVLLARSEMAPDDCARSKSAAHEPILLRAARPVGWGGRGRRVPPTWDLPDKWDEVHYVIEVILPTACWRQAKYCSVTLQPDARDVGDDETRGFSRWRLLLTAALRRRAGVGGACLARGSVPQVTATQRMK